MRYLMAKGQGIVPMPKHRPIRSVFCKHINQISGLDCSEIGLMRISGMDQYRICEDCGKILEEHHTEY